MKKTTYLLKNMGLLTISNFASRLLSFFLVPLYTSVLTTEQYGTYDIFNTTIGLLVPLLSINIFDAVLRFLLDKNINKKYIIRFGAKVTFLGMLIVSAFVLLNSVFTISPLLNNYGILFILMFSTNALNQLTSYIARGLDKISDVAIAGVIATVVSIACNIVFLLVFKWGLTGYFLATILSQGLTAIYFVFKLKLWDCLIKSDNNNENDLRKEMIKYSLPMMLNAIGWWINNLSDRYIVTWMCGLNTNGIYSVGYKIPSILSVFVSIFNQAWTLSAVKEFDPEDKSGFFLKTYNMYNCFITILCSLLICTAKILAGLLYAKDFYVAWVYVPFLTMASMFGAISGYFGGVFAACKDTKIFGRSTLIGALINTVLNLALVVNFDAMGAAIATVISYFAVWIIRIRAVKRYIRFDLNIKRDLLGYVIMILQFLALLFIDESYITCGFLVASFVIIILLFKNELSVLVYEFKKIIRKE